MAGKGAFVERRGGTEQLDKDFGGMNEGAFSHARVGCEDVRTSKDGVHFTSQGAKKILCAHKARIDQFFINE